MYLYFLSCNLSVHISLLSVCMHQIISCIYHTSWSTRICWGKNQDLACKHCVTNRRISKSLLLISFFFNIFVIDWKFTNCNWLSYEVLCYLEKCFKKKYSKILNDTREIYYFKFINYSEWEVRIKTLKYDSGSFL